MMRREIALAFAAALSLGWGSARADSLYTVTATGIIDDAGQDYGIFGGPYGRDLTGQLFTIIETFNVTQSTFNQGNQNEDLNPATVTATVTVGNASVTASSYGPDNTLYLDSAAHSTDFGVSSPVFTAVSNAAFYMQLQVFNGEADIINTLDFIGLDQAYFLTFNKSLTGNGYFQGADNSYFYGSLLTLRLAPPADRVAEAAAVPEPGSLILFLSGLTGLTHLRRRINRLQRQAIDRWVPARRLDRAGLFNIRA